MFTLITTWDDIIEGSIISDGIDVYSLSWEDGKPWLTGIGMLTMDERGREIPGINKEIYAFLSQYRSIKSLAPELPIEYNLKIWRPKCGLD